MPRHPQRHIATSRTPISRRRLLQSSALAGFAIGTSTASRAFGFQTGNDRPRVAVVGTGSRWDHRATGLASTYGSGKEFVPFSDIVAVCDVDADRRERAGKLVKDWYSAGTAPEVLADYRAIIDRDDIDIVHVVTPDHWHAKIAIEAILSGKDVYCEKPMTLTIEEGMLMCEACDRSKRVVQIGTQQRSNQNFLKAIALIRDGRIGKVRKATCSIGGAPTSPELPIQEPPAALDWNAWLGPAPKAPYHCKAGQNGETKSWSRAHYEFRWWYEYSGGKLTDWGAHHVDIATWGLGKTETGPVSLNPIVAEHPVPFVDGYPTVHNQYNTATKFQILAEFADGQQIEIRDDGDNGILFEGTEGRIFCNRGRLTGAPVEALADNPLPEGAVEAVYKDGPVTNHFENFFRAVQDRREPVSDVFSHHRALSTCHLAGIAARLGREIKWDPVEQRMVGDEMAQSMVGRDQRSGFEIEI